MGKPTICIGENKDADQLRGNCEADHAFVFATRIVQFLFYLNPKFRASVTRSSVCVGPVRKPHCWFSHEVAHIFGVQQNAPSEQIQDSFLVKRQIDNTTPGW